jgi:hydroxyethylthiazole kinase-like uncharacterized protein yjeF
LEQALKAAPRLEIISVAQMRAIDGAAAAAGVATRTLMEEAGAAVAQTIAERFSPRSAAIVCGPGNNGGDGWCAARLLSALGWPVCVVTLVPRVQLKGDAADAAAAWDGEVYAAEDLPADSALFVDAMFGAGLTRALDGHAARLAEIMARAPERVVAVDAPSGLDCDTGRVLGEACVRAQLTITFVRKKPAHVLAPGRAYCGEVVVADIGAPEACVAAQGVQLWENHPALWDKAFPWPALDAHKHARGHAMVASGGAGRSGAARLAAGAALRIGAGLATVLSPASAMAENGAHLTAIMLSEAECADDFARAAEAAQALVIGPGFGVEAAHWTKLSAALNATPRAPLVLDADALSLLAGRGLKLTPRDVITPHIGEFNRLFPDLLAASPSRIEAARAASAQLNCVVLLKGPDSVIAAPDGRAIVNTKGSPFLATAGSGDVLAGAIGGLIAQGADSFSAASAAAWVHGRCGEVLGPGLIAEDLHKCFPRVLNTLAPEHLRRRALL